MLSEREEKRLNQTRQNYQAFSNQVNGDRVDKVGLINAFLQDHRTLQCDVFFQVVMPLIEVAASDMYHTDARNEGVQRFAKVMYAALKREGLV